MNPKHDNGHLRAHRLVICAALILAFRLAPCYAQASDTAYMRQFTDLNIGDTISPVDNLPDADGYIYAFIDAASCGTCVVSWTQEMAHLAERYRIQIVAFIVGKTQDYADMEKNRSGWSFTTLGDPKYLFSKYYKVKLAPFYLVCDGGGIVRAMDKCGGVHLGLAEIDDILKFSHDAREVERSASPKGQSRIPIRTNDGKLLDVGDRHFAVRNVAYNCYCLLDAGIGLMHLIDSTGVVTHTVDLRASGGFAMARLQPSWVSGDSIVLDCRQDLNANLAFTFVNLRTGALTALDFRDSMVSLPKSPYVMTQSFFNPSSRDIVVTLHPIDRSRPMQAADPSLMLLATSGESRFRGQPDSLYVTHSMTKVWDCQIGFDGSGRMYEMQTPSSRLRVYSKEGSLIRSAHLSVGSSWRTLEANINKPTAGDWVTINQSMSFIRGIYPSEDGTEVAIIYQNVDYPAGVVDPRSREMQLHTFVHRTTSEGKAIGKDILLPMNEVCHVDRDRVTGVEYAANHISIVLYPLPRSIDN